MVINLYNITSLRHHMHHSPPFSSSSHRRRRGCVVLAIATLVTSSSLPLSSLWSWSWSCPRHSCHCVVGAVSPLCHIAVVIASPSWSSSRRCGRPCGRRGSCRGCCVPLCDCHPCRRGCHCHCDCDGRIRGSHCHWLLLLSRHKRYPSLVAATTLGCVVVSWARRARLCTLTMYPSHGPNTVSARWTRLDAA